MGAYKKDRWSKTLQNMGWSRDTPVPDGIVYGAMHKSGRWYVGSTSKPLQSRKFHHYAAATDPSRAGNLFWTALSSSNDTDWTWSVLEEVKDTTVGDLHKRETHHQHLKNSVDDGYNTIYAFMEPTRRATRGRRQYVTVRADEAKYAKQLACGRAHNKTTAGREYFRQYSNKKRANMRENEPEKHAAYNEKARDYARKRRQDPVQLEKMREANRKSQLKRKAAKKATLAAASGPSFS